MEELQTKVPPAIMGRLQNANINTTEEFLIKSRADIANLTKLTKKDVDLLTKIICESTLKSSFIEELVDCEYLKTGCERIDEIIRGIHINGITEIYGESGCGKTQIGLQLALQVQRSENVGGLNGGCIYICTEQLFPSKRLTELKNYLPHFATDCASGSKSANYEDNIFIEHIDDMEQLKYCLSIRVPILLLRQKIKLIVIDSIAGVFRYDNEEQNYVNRSEDLRYLAQKLCELSDEHRLAVVCINQITSDPVEGDKPCLGLAWTNLIQTRIELSRSNRTIIIDNYNITIRKLKVIFSPFIAVCGSDFIITKKGIQNVP